MKYLFDKVAKTLLLFFVLAPVSLFAQTKIDRQVDSVFRKLSTREKIAQIMVINFTSRDSKEMFEIQKRLVKKEKIGGLIPLGDTFIPAVTRLNELNKLAKIPMLITLDAEWGASMRWPEIPAFQRFIQLGALTSDSLVYEMGKSIAQECRALKVQVNFSPDVDLNNNPERHIVHTRCIGENKEKVAQYAAAMMRGLRDGGVAGSAKHFPGHGDTDVDSHLALPLLPFSAERIDTLEFYPFKRMIAEGVDMVMVGHMNVPALDPTGTPSSISKTIVTGYLREKLGFNGIICTDALDMHGVSKASGLAKKDIPLAAYKAGVDILLMPEDIEESITVIENALKNGEITMEGLDMRVKKMLALKARLGVFDKGYDPLIDLDNLNVFTDQDLKDGIMDKKLDLIKKISKESITVAYNDNSAGFGIPVTFEGKKVAYVGFKNVKTGSDFGIMANRYGPVDTLLLGDNSSVAELKTARQKLEGHDLVIFAFNRSDLRTATNYGIVPEEVEFLAEWAAEQPMIVLFHGSPYGLAKIPGHGNFTSFVVGYLSDQANNLAAAQVIFGGIPAKGVLPVTSGPYKEGHSVQIPERFREEYHHFVGSKDDSLSLVKYDLGEQSAALTLLPQVAELVAGGKFTLSATVGELLGNDAACGLMTVENLLSCYTNPDYASALRAILGKYRSYASVEEVARQMFAALNMTNTELSGSVTGSGSTAQIITTAYDMNKFEFAVGNGGKYAGKQVLSPEAAEIVLKFFKRNGAAGKHFTTVIDGVERRYIMYMPENLQKNAPLFFVLHGYGACPDLVLDKGFNEAADKYGFAVCYPSGSKDVKGNNCWNVGYPFQKDMAVDDVSFLCQLADKLQALQWLGCLRNSACR